MWARYAAPPPWGSPLRRWNHEHPSTALAAFPQRRVARLMAADGRRRVLVVAHTGREDARKVASQFCHALATHGLAVRLLEDEAEDLGLDLPDVDVLGPGPAASADCEIVVVFGVHCCGRKHS